jgi:hypothetical protein
MATSKISDKGSISRFGNRADSDNRRRGRPLPGCDCMQCFGGCNYTHIDKTRENRLPRRRSDLIALRDGFAAFEQDSDVMTPSDKLDRAIYRFDPVKHYEDEPLHALLIFETINEVKQLYAKAAARNEITPGLL